MDLFKNRPLAGICLSLIISATILYRVSASVKLLLIFLLVPLLICALIIAARSKRLKIKAIFFSLCTTAVMLGIITQFIGIDMREQRLRSYEGEYTCRVLILEEEDRASSGEQFRVKIKRLGDDRVSFDGTLYLNAETNLKSGDMLSVRASVLKSDRFYASESSDTVGLDLFVYEGAECVAISRGNFSIDGFFSKIRLGVARYFEDNFGERSGALARGVLLGDTEGIRADTIRDFRRAGVSHLLAVSGLHISMLMTMIELLLRAFYIGKKPRAIILSLSALVFLGMTGFAPSACRSVLMILFVYLHYLFAKESDSVTALFSAVAVMLLFSPRSVADIGLWLSFLATLGIISVYAPISRYFKKEKESGAMAMLKRCLKATALALLLNFLCSIFTSIVVWLAFGEMSLISLIANPILTPLSLVLLVSVFVGMIFAKLGLLGKIAVGFLNLVCEVTERISSYFASFDGAVISLGYRFAGIIITLMSIALFVMLVIHLRRKQLILLPPFVAVAAFAICLSIHNATYSDKLPVTYTLRDEGEMIILTDRYRAAVIDMSSESYSSLKSAGKIVAGRHATEISDYIMTEYHEAGIASLDVFFGKAYVRTLWLPKPQSLEDHAIAYELAYIAAEHGCEVQIYEKGDERELLFDTRVLIGGSGKEKTAVFVAGKGEALSYIGAGVDESLGADGFCSHSDYIIFGTLGNREEKLVHFSVDREKLKSVFYAEREAKRFVRIAEGEYAECYPNERGEARIDIILK